MGGGVRHGGRLTIARAVFAASLSMLLTCVAMRPMLNDESTERTESSGNDIWRVIGELGEIARDWDESESVRAEARLRRGNLLAWTEQEIAIEAGLRMMGYTRCAVSVREKSVYIAAEGFREEDAMKVLSMAVRETGKSPEAVRIWPLREQK